MYQVIDLLINTLHIVSHVLAFAIIGRVLMSWIKPGAERQTAIGEVLFKITEPIIEIARMLPHRIGLIDLSPIIALFGLDLIFFVLIEVLKRLV